MRAIRLIAFLLGILLIGCEAEKVDNVPGTGAGPAPTAPPARDAAGTGGDGTHIGGDGDTGSTTDD